MPFASGFAVGLGLSKPWGFFVFPVNSDPCEPAHSPGERTGSGPPHQADVKCQGVSQKRCGGRGEDLGGETRPSTIWHRLDQHQP